jgi:hypothetical protein
MVAAIGTATFLVVFSALALGLILGHTRQQPSASAPPSTGVAASPVSTVIRDEIHATGVPVTLRVTKGTIIALHLYTTDKSESGWGVELPAGKGIDFQAVEVPYPGSHPPSSGNDFYVAFAIRDVGTTQIEIGIPVTCPDAESCPNLFEQINVTSVAPPHAQPIPNWMASCLAAGGITTAAAAGEPSLTSNEAVATARRFDNELPASAPATPLYLQFVAPDPGTSEGDALASPLWAVGFSGVHGYLPGGIPNAIPESGQIVFVSDPGNKWVLALDCAS